MNPNYRRWALKKFIKKQGNTCCYCRRIFTKDGPTIATIEHKKAKMDGGKDNISNLAAACLHCNHLRGRQMNMARMAKAMRAKMGNCKQP